MIPPLVSIRNLRVDLGGKRFEFIRNRHRIVGASFESSKGLRQAGELTRCVFANLRQSRGGCNTFSHAHHRYDERLAWQGVILHRDDVS